MPRYLGLTRIQIVYNVLKYLFWNDLVTVQFFNVLYWNSVLPGVAAQRKTTSTSSCLTCLPRCSRLACLESQRPPWSLLASTWPETPSQYCPQCTTTWEVCPQTTRDRWGNSRVYLSLVDKRNMLMVSNIFKKCIKSFQNYPDLLILPWPLLACI